MKRSVLPLLAVAAAAGALTWGVVLGFYQEGIVTPAGAAAKESKKASTSSDLWVTKTGGGLVDDDVVKMSSFAKLAKAVSPSVVFIKTDTKTGRLSPFRPVPRGRGVGSGFVINDEGLLLTNYHVVADATRITVRTMDDREYEARIVGADEKVDVALLKIPASAKIPPVPLGNSHVLDIGEWVVAIGNPYGYSHSVTAGIVSAKGRTDIMPGSPHKGPVSGGYYSFIQTDASINPGNSGGPLINIRGEVIGINTAINAAADGIAFAIPIDVVKKMLPDLHAKGHFERSWLGIRIESVDSEIAERMGLVDPHGAVVTFVEVTSPAEEAGLRPKDVVVAFEGEKIRTSADLRWMAAHHGVGREARVLLWRDGKKIPITIKLASLDLALSGGRSAPKIHRWEPTPKSRGDRDSFGIEVGPVPRELAAALGLDPSEGVRVLSVSGGSPAGRKIREDDIIIRISDKPSGRGKVIRSADEFYRRLESYPDGAEVVFELRRGYKRVFAAVRK